MDKAIENYTLFRDTCPKCNSSNITEETQEPLPDGEVIFFYCCLDCGQTFEIRNIAVIVNDIAEKNSKSSNRHQFSTPEEEIERAIDKVKGPVGHSEADAKIKRIWARLRVLREVQELRCDY